MSHVIITFGGKLHQHPVVLICKILSLNKVQETSKVMSKCGEFNKTIIPFALIGYEIGYSQLGATRLVGYLPSHIQRALME